MEMTLRNEKWVGMRSQGVVSWGFLIVVLLVLVGCSSPAVRQQRLVAKPNMSFSDSMAFTYNSARLFPQIAPGFASSGASQNSGCTSCR